MKIRFLTLILLLSASVLYSQKKFDFEVEYERATLLAGKNPDSSEVVLNTIIEKAKKGKELEYAARAYNMKAYLYTLRADAQKCVEFANKSYELSEKINYDYGKALALRTLAIQSARLGMKADALQKFNQAVALLKDDTSQEGYKVRGNIYAAYMGLRDDDYNKKRNYYTQKVIENYEKINDKKVRNGLLTNFYNSLANEYSNQKKFDSSQIWIKKALAMRSGEDIEGKITTFLILAMNYEQQNKQDSALWYCKKSLDLARKHKFKEHELLVIKHLPNLYAILKDTANGKQVLVEASSLLTKNDSINQIAVNDIVVNNDRSFKAKMGKYESRYHIVFCSAIVVLVLLGVFMVWYFRQKKKYRQMVQKIYGENQQHKRESAEKKGVEDSRIHGTLPELTRQTGENSDESQYETLKISPEIEERILKSLDKFEKNHKFNEKGVSLYNLANSFNVNTKYLSAIIRKHKGLSFNKYISQLRINYIVDQLLNEPKFLKYRIQHLAELTGFSSHSAFSAEFKNLMGMHPSVFIRELKSVKE